MIVSGLILLTMRNVSDSNSTENKTQIVCSVTYSENRVVYEILCKIMVQPDRSQMAI